MQSLFFRVNQYVKERLLSKQGMVQTFFLNYSNFTTNETGLFEPIVIDLILIVPK